MYLNPLRECPIVDLSVNLRECSQLKTLKCGHYSHHDILDRIWTADKDLALIELAAGLNAFDLPLCDLTSDPGTMVNISSILESCLSLQAFGADIIGGAWKPTECLGFFEQPWSPSLRAFRIRGVSTDLIHSEEENAGGEYDYTQPYSGNDVLEDFDFDPDEIGVGCAKFESCLEITGGSEQEVKFLARHGWRAPKKIGGYVSDRQLQSRDANIFCKMLLERVVSMPLMEEVWLNMCTWIKITEEEEE